MRSKNSFPTKESFAFYLDKRALAMQADLNHLSVSALIDGEI